MSADSSFLTVDTTALQETVAQLCDGHNRLEEFLRGLFGDLDALASEMTRQGQWFSSSQREQESQLAEQEARLERERQALESTFARIQELTDRWEDLPSGEPSGNEQLEKALESLENEQASVRALLETAESQRQEQLASHYRELEAAFERIEKLAERMGEAGGGHAGQTEELQQLLAGLQEERTSWREALADSESQKSGLVRMAEDLAAARQDLAEARSELREQRELLSQTPAATDHGADPEIRDRLENLEQERLAWAEERAVLETELDGVRTRAAELADTLEDERQRAAGERKTWTEELRQLRQMLQTLNDRETPIASAAAPAAPGDAAPEEPEDAQDPVLDSVMAQFEILQKDLARRRKAKPASKTS